MRLDDQTVEAAAKELFELSPVSRGAKPWDELKEDGHYKPVFRREAREALQETDPQ